MGFLDALLGRRKPSRPDLDKLFEVPAAATTLQLNGWTPTGVGSVCFRSAEGIAFSQTQSDAQDLIEFGGRKVEQTTDSFGFTWLTVRAAADDVDTTSSVVTDLHAVNSSLESAGFGELLLCTLINFVSAGPGPTKTLAIVYLYKQGTFYPFAPRPGTSNQRDNATELAVRPMLAQDLPVEPELSRWLAVLGRSGVVTAAGVGIATIELARTFMSSMEARDWAGVRSVLHVDVVYELPQSRERIRGRDRYIQFNQEFPGDWHLEPLVVLADEQHGSVLFDWRIGDEAAQGIVYFEFADGLITQVTDFWPEPYEPPPGREHLVERW